LAYEYTKCSKKQIAETFYVKYIGERGIDEGGLRRELYDILSHELFGPERGLFKASANGASLQPNPDSFAIPDHLKLFEFAGIITGKAMGDEMPLDVTFTKSFLKHLLDKPVSVGDLGDIDAELTKNLQWILDNDFDDLGMTFTYETKILGQTVYKELQAGGADLEVDIFNKKDYVKKVCEAIMTKEIEPQIAAFIKGFRYMVPDYLLTHLIPSGLSILISGQPTIDVDEMREYCRY
jgi:E3 ubiquitin-protein ligase HUWE1